VQVARCFRDEDLPGRSATGVYAARHGKSFVTHEDRINVIDELMQRLSKKFLGTELKLPLARMKWDEAMERFGTMRRFCGLAASSWTARNRGNRRFSRVPRDG